MHPTMRPPPALKRLLLILLATLPMTTLVQAQDQELSRDLSEDAAEAVTQPPRDEAPRRPAPPYYEAVVIQAQAVLATPDPGCWIQADTTTDTRTETETVTAAGAGADTYAGADAPGLALSASPRCGDVQSTGNLHHWSVLYTFRGRQYRAQLSSHPGPTLMVDRYGMPRG